MNWLDFQTPTVVFETVRLQVHPDFELRGLTVGHTLLRWGGGHQTGYHFTAGISAHVFSPNYNMAAYICHHSIL